MAQYGEITVQFSSPIYYVFEKGTMTIEVVLSAPSTDTVTVEYATADGTATAGADYTATKGMLEFKPGETSTTFVVPTNPDTIVEDTEWFTVSLSKADKATISPTQGTATVTITDVYTPPVTLEFSDWYYSGKEGTTAVIKVSLSNACSQDVQFQCVVSDGTATTGTDYLQAGTLDLTIPAGLTNASFQIGLLTDATVEYDESVNLELKLTSNSPPNVSLGVISQSILFIQDLFEIPTVTFAPTPIKVLKGQTINVMATAFPATFAADIAYEVVAYDIDGDGNPDSIASVSPGAPDPMTGETVLAVHGDLAGTSVVRALYQSLEIGSAPLYVVSVDFSPSPVKVPLGGEARVTAIVVPEAALPWISFDVEDPGIATYSGAPPNFELIGQSEGTTNFRAFLDTAFAASVAVEVQKQAVTLKLDGPFVLVSPSTVAAADRPSLKLTVELIGNPGDKADVTLKSAGTGGVEFEKNPLKDVTVGTPQTILVFGNAASTARDSTKIEARIDPVAGPPDATVPLTVVKGVKVWFLGHFECRLPTDPAPSDTPTGGVGWTTKISGEPDFDRIIRFSGPKVRRPPAPAFKPVIVKKIITKEPAGVEFNSGDNVLGLGTNLGGNNFFAGQDKGFGPTTEPIGEFKILVGDNIVGQEDQGENYKKAAQLKVPADRGFALRNALAGKEGGYLPALGKPVEDINKDRQKFLKDGLGNAANNQEKADFQARLTRIFNVSEFYGYAGQYEITIPNSKASVKNVGDSQVLKLLKIRVDNGGGFGVNLSFYAYDGDILWGRVQGEIIIDNP